MPYDYVTQRGQFKGAKPDAGGAVLQSHPVLGIVKDNTDVGRTGKLRVLLISENTNVDPNDERSWRSVNYMTPFFGMTEGSPRPTGLGSYTETPNSYGMWFPAPDIGTLVVCIFIEGRPNFGFVIGCVPKAEALSMLPGISAAENVTLTPEEASAYGGAKRLPTVNINPRNPNSNQPNYYSQPRPVHSYQAAILQQQGLLRDELRGTISSNAQRETPSRVLGISTPGRPIYEGGFTDETISNQPSGPATKIIARRGGHTFVMDDGDLKGKDNLVRLRSANGHTILMSDDGQTLFIIHSNGQSWVELGKEGTVDVYATNSVNLRTQGDLNLHADRNINVNAGNELNLSGKTVRLESKTGMTQRVGTDYSAQTGGNHGVLAGGSASYHSGGAASLQGSSVFVVGKPINLNTGSSSFVPPPVTEIPYTLHPDALWSTDRGWLSTPFKLPSIVSRAPTHQPWPLAGLGVGVDVKMTEDSALPAPPTPAVTAANAASETAEAPTPQPGATNTVPTVNPTAAAQAATQAAQTNPPAGATGVGNLTPQQAEAAGFIKPGSSALVQKLITEGKPVPDSMMTGKNGVTTWESLRDTAGAQTAAITDSVATAAKQLTSAGVMTGKEDPKSVAGVTLAGAVSGVNSVTNFMQNVGRLPTGLGAATAALSNASAAVSSITDAAGKIGGLIKGGNLAATGAGGVGGLVTSITDGAGAIGSKLLGGVTSVFSTIKTTAAGIFNSVKSALPSLPSGEPVNLRERADSAAASAQTAKESSGLTGALGSITGGIKTVASSITGGVSAITGRIGGLATSLTSGLPGIGSATGPLEGSKNALGSAATAAAASVTASVAPTLDPNSGPQSATVAQAASSSVAQAQSTVSGTVSTVSGALQSAAGPVQSGGLSGLPGGIGAAASVVNMENPLSKLPGVGDLAKGLSGLAAGGVPAAVQNQLQSTLASLNTSDLQVKLPEAATNTNDSTKAVAASVSKLVGPGVPPPPV